jgi:single-strand DNA-binding protein
MINQVTLVGRLTKDPDLRITPEGTAVCNLTLAVNRPFKNQHGEYETDFVHCTIWRKTAENTANFCRKGSVIGITGKIHTRNYMNQEGKRVYVTEVVAETVQFLSRRSTTEEQKLTSERNSSTSDQGGASASASALASASASSEQRRESVEWIPTMEGRNGSNEINGTTNAQNQSSNWMVTAQKAKEEANVTAGGIS